MKNAYLGFFLPLLSLLCFSVSSLSGETLLVDKQKLIARLTSIETMVQQAKILQQSLDARLKDSEIRVVQLSQESDQLQVELTNWQTKAAELQGVLKASLQESQTLATTLDQHVATQTALEQSLATLQTKFENYVKASNEEVSHLRRDVLWYSVGVGVCGVAAGLLIGLILK